MNIINKKTLLSLAWSFCYSVSACQFVDVPNNNKRLLFLLDYIAENSALEIISVAECSDKIYKASNFQQFAKAYPKKAEQLFQDVTKVQLSATKTLSDGGDIQAAERFRKNEIELRRKVLEDIESLPETEQAELRLEKVRQIAYLTQALEKGSEGRAIDNLLSGFDLEILQGQVLNSWIKSVATCPKWKTELSGAMGDEDLRKNLCRSECKASTEGVISTIDKWKSLRVRDWDRNSELRSFYQRVRSAIRKCGR